MVKRRGSNNHPIGWLRPGLDAFMLLLTTQLVCGCEKAEAPAQSQASAKVPSTHDVPPAADRTRLALPSGEAARGKARIEVESEAAAPARSAPPIHRPRVGAFLPVLPPSQAENAKATIVAAEQFEEKVNQQPAAQACRFAVGRPPKDSWGTRFDVECQLGVGNLVITSAGPDRKLRTTDDIRWVGSPAMITDDRLD